jgi:F-box-like
MTPRLWNSDFEYLKASFNSDLYQTRPSFIKAAVGQFKGDFPSFSGDQRLEFAYLVQQEFLRRSSQVKHDEEALQTLKDQFIEARRLVTPIYCLPVEILTEIFHLVLNSGQSLTRLMPVCQYWHDIIDKMAYIWPIRKLVLGSWMEVDPVLHKAWGLDVLIDTDWDAGARDSPDDMYSGLITATENMARWRSLTVSSLPKGNVRPFRRLFSSPMNRLEHLKIGLQSESSLYLDQLLQNVSITAIGSLTSIDISSVHALQYLIQSPYVSILRSLTALKVEVRQMSVVDLLPHLTRLEVLEATNLLIPSYHDDFPLPVVHSLRQLRLTAVSVQWMGGRTFPRLESCHIIVLPRDNPLVLDVHLPACTDLRFGNRNVIPLIRMFRMPKFERLTLDSNEWTPALGSYAVIDICRAGLGTLIRPRILHFALLCRASMLLSALQLLPDLEELTLELPRPSALGWRFFRELLAKPIDQLDLDGSPFGWEWEREQKMWRTITCPFLNVLRLRYQRWLRQSDSLDALSSLLAIGQSRSHTSHPLTAFQLCFRASDGVWQTLELEPPAPRLLTSLGVPQFKTLPEFHEHRSLFKACLTSNTLCVLNLACSNGAVINLMEPLFGHSFHDLRSLTIRGNNLHLSFTALCSFQRLEDLSLIGVEYCPLYSHHLPLAGTLRKLYIENSSPLWMDGRVFPKLKTVVFVWVRWPESFRQGVGMPICSHVEINGYGIDEFIHLQSIFHFPVLDKFEIEVPLFPKGYSRADDKRAFDALQRIRARALYFSIGTDSQRLLEMLESRDEVEVLMVRSYGEDMIEGFLAALQMNTGKLLCPNLKVLGLQDSQFKQNSGGRIRQWCEQTLINRRHASHTLKCCRIWTHDWQKGPLLSMVISDDGVVSVEGEKENLRIYRPSNTPMWILFRHSPSFFSSDFIGL